MSDPAFAETPYEASKKKQGYGLHNPDPLLMQRRVESLNERLRELEATIKILRTQAVNAAAEMERMGDALCGVSSYDPAPETDTVERGALGEPL